jgi:hypothetical protein
MAWPWSNPSLPPNIDSGLQGSIGTSLADAPNFAHVTTWMVYVWCWNKSGAQRVIELADSTGAIFADFTVPDGFAGPLGDLFLKQQTGLQWKADSVSANLKLQAVAYQ